MSQFTDEQRAKFLGDVSDEVGDLVLREVAKWAFAKCESIGFEVLHVPHDMQEAVESQIDWTNHAIYLSPFGEPGAARLWDLLHELGHLHDAPPPPGYVGAKTPESHARESIAWDGGWKLAIAAVPALVAYEGQYLDHAAKLLSSYES